MLAHIQLELGSGLSALGAAVNKLLDKDSQDEANDILPTLIDSAKYITQAHFLLSNHRRHQIYPKMNINMQKVAKECNFDTYLFGKDFTKQCESATSIENSSKKLRLSLKHQESTSTRSFKNLNSRRPFTKSRFKRINVENRTQRFPNQQQMKYRENQTTPTSQWRQIRRIQRNH